MNHKLPIKVTIALFLALSIAFPLVSQTGSEIVYVTGSGRLYHLDGCSRLRSSKIAVTLSDAVISGYGACSVCKPQAADAASFQRKGVDLYRLDLAALHSVTEADVRQMLRAEVVAHIDGDTVRVRIAEPPAALSVVETIRMIGVDTPETVHPRRAAERFGKEASDFTKERLYGKIVYLAFDWDLRDRYGRLLAYIFLHDPHTGSVVCHNAALIAEGFGHAYTRFPFHFMEEFRALEQGARNAQRGLWGA
ncbi:MAG: thermonuclease family protein [Treponema sp.]|nr:thermonuclease family protein [Treponema sp.]